MACCVGDGGLALTLTIDATEVTPYVPLQDGRGEDLRQLLAFNDIPGKERSRTPRRVPTPTLLEDQYVPLVPEESPHRSSLGVYRLGAGLGVSYLVVGRLSL